MRSSRVRASRIRASRTTGRALLCALAVGLLAAPPVQAAASRAETGEEHRPRAAVPTDVRALIRDHFRTQLPFGWFATDPIRFLGGYEVNLRIPDPWRGNPAGQASLLCPDRRSAIWEQTQRLVIRPIHKTLPWAPFECRRGQI